MSVEIVTTQRVLRGVADTFVATYYNDEGVIVDPDTTTIGIVDATGATIVAAGTATTGSGAEPRTFSLTTTHTANLNLLTVTLTSADYGVWTTTLEVIGRHLFSMYEARTFHDSALGDWTKYPARSIAETRERVTDEFEMITGVSFVPRYEYVTQSGPISDGRTLLVYKRTGEPALKVTSVRSVDLRSFGSSTWTAFSPDELTDTHINPYGELLRESAGAWLSGVENTRVGYEHGYQTIELPIKNAALILTRYLLVPSNVNSRALTEISEFGSVQLATAGRFGDHYGIPQVDSVLDRYQQRVPVVR